MKLLHPQDHELEFLYEEYVFWTSEMNEGFNIKDLLAKIPDALKGVSEFIKKLIEITGVELKKLVEFLKDKRVFAFFKFFSFSIEKIFSAFKIFHQFLDGVSKKLADTKLAKDAQAKLKLVDDWIETFSKDPKVQGELKFLVKNGIGTLVAGILLYIWFQMSFTGDANYDFDMSTSISAALHGDFKLAEIFAGPEGIKMITLLVAGSLGLGFPWPGPASIKFVASLIYSLAKKYGFSDLVAILKAKIS